MDEIIVRVCRTLASLPRLRLLALLAREGECTPTDLARKLRRPLNGVCVDLRHLSVAGMVLRRKSGTWCYYRAESPYEGNAFSAQVTNWFVQLAQQTGSARST